MKSIFEQMGGTYHREGDYLLPDLVLPDEPQYPLGKYGHMRESYLREYRPILYNQMLLSGTLNQHLAEVAQVCDERMEYLVSEMAKREGVTEALKATAQMEWVGWMNNIQNRAEEIILQEVVYA